MLNNGIFSDILVIADGGSLKAHRAVLAARSPVFMCMFSIDLEEKEQCIVDISDMSLEACRAFIRYIYGSIHRSELLSAGDKYDIVELKNNMCEISMVDDADNDNVLERLQMAHLYGLSTLKKTCMWLLVEFFKIYDAPEDFREFVHTENTIFRGGRWGDPLIEIPFSEAGHPITHPWKWQP
ncbi:hypothetical protein SETIT_2G246800v2 [Setaria italica]|uniref:BTB domain-containing protein n=1 Tax=Setaria italica TaxID=4555 RepID=A0A368Q2X7_SETIT|nr:hypothetical protein SETIT_2G246800v2 [Setaria italica]